MVTRTVDGSQAGSFVSGLRAGRIRLVLAFCAALLTVPASADVRPLGAGQAPDSRGRLVLAAAGAEDLAHAGLPKLGSVQTLSMVAGEPALTGPALSGRPGVARGPGRDDEAPQGYTLVLGGFALVAFLAHRRWSR